MVSLKGSVTQADFFLFWLLFSFFSWISLPARTVIRYALLSLISSSLIQHSLRSAYLKFAYCVKSKERKKWQSKVIIFIKPKQKYKSINFKDIERNQTFFTKSMRCWNKFSMTWWVQHLLSCSAIRNLQITRHPEKSKKSLEQSESWFLTCSGSLK